MLSLQQEISLNKNADCKIVGICIETRPDSILENDEDGIPWLKTLLLWGVTRIQIGVQHIDNYILKKINRGHSIEDVIKAIEIMKNNCFKVDIHLMPDLPYSSPEKDKNMFNVVFKSDKIQADQLKIYPCEVVPWTKIKKWYEEGTYKPYGENKQLIKEVLQYGMNLCKPWNRICRMVRDIPDTYIEGGMKCGNMRQELISKFNDENLYSGDIRFREIGRHPKYKFEDAVLKIRNYKASNGNEYFISYETKDEKAIYGFIRLRIPFSKRITNVTDENNMKYSDFKVPLMFPETLKKSGLIRELHVYGGLHKVNSKKNVSSFQHKGLGTKLLHQAEEICLKNKIYKISIISGIGVRKYYEKKGYHLENTFMVKNLQNKFYESEKFILSSIFIILFSTLITYLLCFTKNLSL
jgi:ELP3 family radical SAM enzyme/protein acetyltransferase